ncbi:uncharacterized protein LOC26528523 [Drosophila mojavensis]|uniref:PPIase cyclophilin-type domain-containing protein n=1 Tax=Drosophila mojavensis TaxID=7230 RepID=A0A0Q9XID6_DROMO|nr:uncharacterized protein LOC26528523 [Drosophila mojavensis]KRG04802.1 uncharacterized protein Dmoj_GI26882 [Drosophila mojavensis]
MVSHLPKCLSEFSLEEPAENVEEVQKSKSVGYKKKKLKKHTPSRPMGVLELARYTMWREHRERLMNIVSEIDQSPPATQAVRQTRVNALREEAQQFMQRTKENIHMLLNLSQTMRTHGAIDPFRHDAPYVMSMVPATISDLEQLEQDNFDMGKRLLSIGSEIDSGLKADGAANKRDSQPFVMPDRAMAKYKPFNIKLPSTDKERWQLFRPRIYFEMYLKDARPLGRIVVQLYTEAAPVVVLQLVRACMCNMHNKFQIKRLFPNLWLDVELPTENNTALNSPLEYDGKIIDHGSGGYVLSFSKSHLTGFGDSIPFSISFKPLHVVNGSRVGFGRVVKGSKIFECLQSYGNKNGTLSRGLTFTDCGVL